MSDSSSESSYDGGDGNGAATSGRATAYRGVWRSASAAAGFVGHVGVSAELRELLGR
jgi:hypothetical protein